MGIHVQTDYYEEHLYVCVFGTLFCILFYLLELFFQGDINRTNTNIQEN